MTTKMNKMTKILNINFNISKQILKDLTWLMKELKTNSINNVFYISAKTIFSLMKESKNGWKIILEKDNKRKELDLNEI